MMSRDVKPCEPSWYLDAVARCEPTRSEVGARDDVPVHRHGDAPPVETQGAHEALHRAAGRHRAGLSVHE
jgi:hypothetical protein